METIALVFTAVRGAGIATLALADVNDRSYQIRMCLDEWKSGSYKPLMFSSDVYEPVYRVHLANLKALEEEDPLFVKGIGDELWEDCRYVNRDFLSALLTSVDTVNRSIWKTPVNPPRRSQRLISPTESPTGKNAEMHVLHERRPQLLRLSRQISTARLSLPQYIIPLCAGCTSRLSAPHTHAHLLIIYVFCFLCSIYYLFEYFNRRPKD